MNAISRAPAALLRGADVLRRCSHLSIAILFLFAALLVLPRPLLAQETRSAEDPGQLAQSLLQLINETRFQHGLAPFQQQPQLMQAAEYHVVDMAAHQLYSHAGSNGSSVEMRTGRLGYAGSKGVSENWVSTRSPAGALAWWMNSYVHRSNLLNPKWDEIGVGVARDPANGLLLFVLVFGGGSSGDGGGIVQAASVDQAPAAAPVPVVAPPPPPGTPYVVQPGDTLLAIALRYNLTWQAVAARNGLSEQAFLQIGQTITLPIEPTIAAGTTPGIGGRTDTVQGHTIRSGDTLVGIAARYGVPWEDLAAANNLGADGLLHIGQTLRIPTVARSAGSEIPSPRIYTVQAGDTVISIALRFDLDWQALLRLNGLSEQTVLDIGQQIRLN